MKRLFPLFVLLICTTAFTQVIVNLRQPPPGMWNVEEMWNLTLTNTTPDNINVYLRGTAHERTRGLIYEARSADFELVAGRAFRVERHHVEPVDIDYEDDELTVIIERTGELPAGDYTICIYAHNAGTRAEIGRDCYTMRIDHVTPPQLISPDDDATVEEAMPVFMWLPPMPMPRRERVTYQLKIVQILGRQLKNEAIEANPAFFTQDNIVATSFQYPISARGFEQDESYAWQITALGNDDRIIGRSPVWGFNFRAGYAIHIDSFFVECLFSGSYTYRMYISNPNSSPSELVNHTVTNAFPASPPPNPVINFSPALPITIPAGGQVEITGNITTDTHVNRICIGNQLQDPSNSFNFASRDTCYEPIYCPDCCEDFFAEIEDMTIIMTEDGDYIVQGNITAGPGPMCEIKVQMSYFHYTYTNTAILPEGCKCDEPCVWPSPKFGNFTGPTTFDGQPAQLTTFTLPGTGAPLFDYSREFIWKPSLPTDITNMPFSFGLLLPDARCCEDEIEMCIRFSFTDFECVTCDTVISVRFTRCPLSPIDISLLNEWNTDYYYAANTLSGGNSNLDAYLRREAPLVYLSRNKGVRNED